MTSASSNARGPARESSPWFPLYADDLIAATHWWHPAALGVYTRLLMHQASQGSLPNDWTGELRAIAGGHQLPADEWDAIVAQVSPKFAAGSDGRLRNARLERELAERESRRQTAIANGRRGGEAKRKQSASKRPSETEATTSTSTTTPPEVVVGEPQQLELGTGLVSASKPPPRPDDDATQALAALGSGLLDLMGLPSRPLSAQEMAVLADKQRLLTEEALARLRAWYPSGRKRKRRTPDALLYLLADLEACLDQCAPATRGKQQPVTSRVPEAFRAWLQAADLGSWASLRQDPGNAWLCAPVRGLYQQFQAA